VSLLKPSTNPYVYSSVYLYIAGEDTFTPGWSACPLLRDFTPLVTNTWSHCALS